MLALGFIQRCKIIQRQWRRRGASPAERFFIYFKSPLEERFGFRVIALREVKGLRDYSDDVATAGCLFAEQFLFKRQSTLEERLGFRVIAYTLI